MLRLDEFSLNTSRNRNIDTVFDENDNSFVVNEQELETNTSNSYASDVYSDNYVMSMPINDLENLNEELPGLKNQKSVLQRFQSNYSFFNSKLKSQRQKLLIHFLFVYLLIAVMILGIFSIYWGSMVNRGSRLKNMQFLVVIEDVIEVGGVPPIIGDSFYQLLQTTEARYHGTWNVFNLSQWNTISQQNNRSPVDEIQFQIHNQHYWSGLYIKPNTSVNWVQAVFNGDSRYNVSENTITNIYETGRDFINMNSYVTPTIRLVEYWWLNSQSNVSRKLLEHVKDRHFVSSQESLDIITAPMIFAFEDLAPWDDYVLLAPSQVGLIYMIIITFFQVNFFADLHNEVEMSKLCTRHYYRYRIFSAVLSYFVISLFMALLTLACQVNFTVTYGKFGFIVYWMLCFLTMIAVGSVNEVMGLLVMLFYPPVLGFGLIFWVIINITPTFTPIELLPKFFRYGYAMPIYNSYEASKTVFFDTYKGQMGRNIGILVAWCILGNIFLVPVIKLFRSTMDKRIEKSTISLNNDCKLDLKTEERDIETRILS